MSPTWIPFGTIARAHGVRGELRVVPDDLETALPPKVSRICARGRDGSERILEVLQIRPVHRALLMRLVGIDDRDAAQALGGSRLEIDQADLPPPSASELYVYELEGAVAVDVDGKAVGIVRRLLQTPAHDLLEIETPTGMQLLPWVDEFVGEYDRETRELTVSVPDGLWEE